MKHNNRILAVLLILAILLSYIPMLEVEVSAAEQTRDGYMTLEEAGAVLRQYLVDRRTDTLTLNVHLEVDRNLTEAQAGEIIRQEAIKHTGNGKEGDYLRWSVAWFSTNGVTDDFNGKEHYLTIAFGGHTYYTDHDQELELDAKVAQILEELDLSEKTDYEKVCAIHEYVCTNVVYAMEVYENGKPDLWNVPKEHYPFYSAYGALVNGKATCQGYALAMYRLLLEVGVDNRLISGMSDDQPHGWNIVKLGDLYYNLDATWDSTYYRDLGVYLCFLKSPSEFWPTHMTDNYCTTAEFRAKYPLSPLNYGAEATAADSGQCGENIYWELTEDGTLTIRGDGEMWDMADLSAPWDSYNPYIQKVVIEQGVTYIGAKAFRSCQELTSVSIANSVTSIGPGAWEGCGKLASIVVPDSVTDVGENCFAYCWSLQDVTLPNKLTAISKNMLLNCMALKEITIPKSVTVIGYAAFANCIGLQSVVIPDSVTEIGAYAFNSAFDPQLEVTVTIPSNVTQVGDVCFAHTGAKEIIWNAQAERVGLWMFYNSPYLEKVVLADTITWMGPEVFAFSNNLKSANLPAKLETIEEHWQGIFEGCSALEQIVVPEAIRVIPERMFSGCFALRSITLPEGVVEIQPYAFRECAITQIELPDSLEIIGEGAFSDCTSLESIVIPQDVTQVGAYAFLNCTSLTKVKFTGNAPSIGEFAFLCVAPGSTLYVYRPEGDDTWTEAIMVDYTGNGNMKWVHGASVAHTFSDIWQSDETGHWRECTGCEYKDKEEHSYQFPCDIYCNICYHRRDVTHNFQLEWDAYSHLWICACGEVNGTASAHEWSDGVCGICGDQWETVHDHDYWLYSTDTQHWYICNSCGFTTEAEDHYSKGETCDVCGVWFHNIHDLINRNWDEEYHWYVCGCGFEAEPEKHNPVWFWDDNAHWQACECGQETGYDQHNWRYGACTVCHAAKPEDPAPTESTPPPTQITETTGKPTEPLAQPTKPPVEPAGSSVVPATTQQGGAEPEPAAPELSVGHVLPIGAAVCIAIVGILLLVKRKKKE